MQTEASESSPKAHQRDGCRVVSADPVPDYLSIRYCMRDQDERADGIIWTLLTFRS